MNINFENIKDKIVKLNDIKKCPTKEKFNSNEKILNVQKYDNKINTNSNECDKTLKELKENTILLRQKLDGLESERNLMDVEYVQVFYSTRKNSFIIVV